MTEVNNSLSSGSVTTASTYSAGKNSSSDDFNISEIEMLFQQVMQKMRQTGNKLATSQSLHNFEMQKTAVSQKRKAASETKIASLITSASGIIGGGGSMFTMLGGNALIKTPSGMLNDKKVGVLNSRLGNITAENKKLTDGSLGNIQSQLDEKWSNYYNSMNEGEKVKFKNGLLQLDEQKPNKLKLNNDVDRLRNDCVENFDTFCAEIEKGMDGKKLTSKQRNAANKWLEGKLNQFNKLNAAIKNLHPDTYQSSRREVVMAMSQAMPGLINAGGGSVAADHTQSASSRQIAAEFIKDNQSMYDRQRGIDADNLRTNLQKFMDNMRSLVDLHGAMLNAGTMK